MADQKRRLSELPTSTSADGLYTLGVNERNEGVKIPFGDIIAKITTNINDIKTVAEQSQKLAEKANSTANGTLQNSDVLQNQINNLEKSLQRNFSELIERCRILPFDGFVDSLDEADDDSVKFVSSNEYTFSCYGEIDNTDYNSEAAQWHPREDTLFVDRSHPGEGMNLYYFDGITLRRFLTEWDAKEINDKLAAITPKVNAMGDMLADLDNALNAQIEAVGELESKVKPEELAEIQAKIITEAKRCSEGRLSDSDFKADANIAAMLYNLRIWLSLAHDDVWVINSTVDDAVKGIDQFKTTANYAYDMASGAQSEIGKIKALINADADGTINKFNEIVAFLAGIVETKTLNGLLGDIATQIAAVKATADTVSEWTGLLPSGEDDAESGLLRLSELVRNARTDYSRLTGKEADKENSLLIAAEMMREMYSSAIDKIITEDIPNMQVEFGSHYDETVMNTENINALTTDLDATGVAEFTQKTLRGIGTLLGLEEDAEITPEIVEAINQELNGIFGEELSQYFNLSVENAPTVSAAIKNSVALAAFAVGLSVAYDIESLTTTAHNALYNSQQNISKIEEMREDIDALKGNATGKRSALTPLYETAGAHFNDKTGFYELNGLTDITEEQMRVIYDCTSRLPLKRVCFMNSATAGMAPFPRTTLPSITDRNATYPAIPSNYAKLEVLKLTDHSPATPLIELCKAAPTFSYISYSYKLREVLDIVKLNEQNRVYYCNQCWVLTTIKMYVTVPCTISFEKSPKISLESFRFLVDNAAHTSGIVTVKVDAALYDKITGASDPDDGTAAEDWVQLLDDAAAKNISFVKI